MTTEGRWETVDTFPAAALVGLGDPRLLDEETWRDKDLPHLHVRRSGYGMVYGAAETDGLPVEALRSPDEAMAVRLEYVDDVEDLERTSQGRWHPLGRLRIGRSGAVAVAYEDDDIDVIAVPLPAGWYQVESFEADSDALGVRLINGET